MPAPIHRSRIQLDSSLRRWFHRNLGLWRSRRTLYFPDDEILQLDIQLRIEEISPSIEGETAWLPACGLNHRPPLWAPVARVLRLPVQVSH
jgi:hypothetical protein